MGNQNVGKEPVKTARAALHLLTSRGLPPTPENYAQVYREILGEPPSDSVAAPEQNLTTEQKLDNSRELVDILRTLISAITEKTGHLADDLGRSSQDMRNSISALEQAEEKQEISALLGILLATTQTIQNTVDEAHVEISRSQTTLENMRNDLQETRRLLVLDPLTGARNRFGMDTSLGQEISRARRNGSKLTIAMIDLDYFKNINDEYGHDVGDMALVYFAQLSKAVLRESDTLYRYGGEEFLITLPETDIAGAIFMLERLRDMLTKSPLAHGNRKIKFSFSSGVTGALDGDNVPSILSRADRGLYQAKEQGRNRIITVQE